MKSEGERERGVDCRERNIIIIIMFYKKMSMIIKHVRIVSGVSVILFTYLSKMFKCSTYSTCNNGIITPSTCRQTCTCTCIYHISPCVHDQLMQTFEA